MRPRARSFFAASAARSFVASMPRRGGGGQTSARAFTLLEVLLAIALLGSLLVALNMFIFSMAEVWGKGREERLFAQHARAVSVHIEDLLRRAALSPEGGGLEVKEVKQETILFTDIKNTKVQVKF